MAARIWRSDSRFGLPQPIAARLAWISPDRIEPRDRSAPYFPIRLELVDRAASGRKPLRMQPGEPVSLLLLTGEQSLFERVLAPLRQIAANHFASIRLR
jgi:hypothetical protein